jgi:hypothetical protein
MLYKPKAVSHELLGIQSSPHFVFVSASERAWAIRRLVIGVLSKTPFTVLPVVHQAIEKLKKWRTGM